MVKNKNFLKCERCVYFNSCHQYSLRQDSLFNAVFVNLLTENWTSVANAFKIVIMIYKVVVDFNKTLWSHNCISIMNYPLSHAHFCQICHFNDILCHKILREGDVSIIKLFIIYFINLNVIFVSWIIRKIKKFRCGEKKRIHTIVDDSRRLW